MHDRMNKFMLRKVVLFCFCCLISACSFSEVEKKPRVLNPRPVPEFSIPTRDPGENHVYFIALGDQGKGGEPQSHVARLMNEKARADSLHFVITLGDNFYNDGVTSVEDIQWRDKFENMYDLPFLNVPFYASLGNHDYHNDNAWHQVEYAKKGGKWKMPHNYYTFVQAIDDNSSIQLFALDSQQIKQRDDHDAEQLAWLERELRLSTATWKVVYGHHPLFSYGKHGNVSAMIENVQPILEKYRVDAYIAGHDHDRQLLGPRNGVFYIVSGTGSKSRNTSYGDMTVFAETNLGFAWFRVSPIEFHVQFINAEGKIEYAHTWTKDMRHHDSSKFTTK